VRDQQPVQRARRKARRKDRFGRNDFCLFCGYGCLESLTQVSRQWIEMRGMIQKGHLDRFLEEHHVVGEAHDPALLVTLCLNCHREITEGLACEGVSMYPEQNIHKLVALVLRGSAVFFEFLASSYRKWASLLEDSDEE